MQTEETKDTGDTAKSVDFEFASMGKRMCEMMSKCCPGQGGFPDCSAMMKNMMEAMEDQPCCKPRTENSKFDGEKK